MFTPSIVGLFCEDVRDEKNGQQTIVGVFPDATFVGSVPAVLPKLVLYVRTVFSPNDEVEIITMLLKNADGEEIEMNKVPVELLRGAQNEVRKTGSPVATIVSVLGFANFPIPTHGRIALLARIGKRDHTVCTLKFQGPPATSSTEPSPPV